MTALKGLAGFVVGAIFGLLVAYVIARAVLPWDQAGDDFTGLVAILFSFLALVGAGLAMLVFGIVGMLLAIHYL